MDFYPYVNILEARSWLINSGLHYLRQLNYLVSVFHSIELFQNSYPAKFPYHSWLICQILPKLKITYMYFSVYLKIISSLNTLSL